MTISHALGQALLDLGQPLLDRVDHVERVLAVAHDDDAADRLALAVELGEAAADVGPSDTSATSRTRIGVPPGADACSGTMLEVLRAS